MRQPARFAFLAPFALAALLAGAAAAETVGYPSAQKPSFLVDYPANWEMTPGEGEGDYVTLMSPEGTTLMMRTIPGTKESMEQAVKDNYEYLGENYTDLKLSDPADSEHRGLTGFYATGTGKDEEGTPMRFGMAWYALNDKEIGEIWFVASEDDKAGIAAAGKILESFRAP
jgi:hypothetical protein